jgi:hypothetical protein
MMNRRLIALTVIAAAVLSSRQVAQAQSSASAAVTKNDPQAVAGWVVGHPFSATKYARRIKVLPDGKEQFIVNLRYPVKIARDEQGRIMMQKIGEDLLPECDKLEMPEPPPCPAWGTFVMDPVVRTDTHWLRGERAAHGAVDMPLSQDQLEEVARVTSEIPEVAPDIDTDATDVSTADLGDKTVEGMMAHGVRTTVIYPAGHSGNQSPITWIHEVWTAPEMKLIVRVVEGDPHGEELVWGLEKISLQPDPALFRPPDDYELQHRKNSMPFSGHDFEVLQSWFAR